jgi:hypothetical protein
MVTHGRIRQLLRIVLLDQPGRDPTRGMALTGAASRRRRVLDGHRVEDAWQTRRPPLGSFCRPCMGNLTWPWPRRRRRPTAVERGGQDFDTANSLRARNRSLQDRSRNGG